MTTSLLPVPKARFFDASGNPLAGGKVYTYAAGTTTPKASYTDSTGNTANANPVVLDAAGEANIWLSGLYKVVLKNSAGAEQWTVDNVSANRQVPIFSNTTFYVNTSTGSNSNSGLASNAAWATLEYAVNQVAGNYIYGAGAVATIDITGDCAENVNLPRMIGAFADNRDGIVIDMNGYKINPATNDGFTSVGTWGWEIKDCWFKPATGTGLNADNGTNISLSNPIFDSATRDILCNFDSTVAIYGTHEFRGTRSEGVFISQYQAQIIAEASTLTFTGTPNLGTLAICNKGGKVVFSAIPTYSGSFTGKNYALDGDFGSRVYGQINIGGGSQNSTDLKIPAIATRSASFTLTGTAWTVVNFDATVVNGNGYWDLATDKFTAAVSGLYRIKASAQVNYGGVGTATLTAIGIFLNGSGTPSKAFQDRASYAVNNSVVSTVEVEAVVALQPGDYVQIGVYSASLTPTLVADATQNFAEFEYLSPLLV